MTLLNGLRQFPMFWLHPCLYPHICTTFGVRQTVMVDQVRGLLTDRQNRVMRWSELCLCGGCSVLDDLRAKDHFSTTGMLKGRSGTGKLGMNLWPFPFVWLVMVVVDRHWVGTWVTHNVSDSSKIHWNESSFLQWDNRTTDCRSDCMWGICGRCGQQLRKCGEIWLARCHGNPLLQMAGVFVYISFFFRRVPTSNI